MRTRHLLLVALAGESDGLLLARFHRLLELRLEGVGRGRAREAHRLLVQYVDHLGRVPRAAQPELAVRAEDDLCEVALSVAPAPRWGQKERVTSA